MGRGSYLGGSTIINLWDKSWFGHSSRKDDFRAQRIENLNKKKQKKTRSIEITPNDGAEIDKEDQKKSHIIKMLKNKRKLEKTLEDIREEKFLIVCLKNILRNRECPKMPSIINDKYSSYNGDTKKWAMKHPKSKSIIRALLAEKMS